jgi:hypothetical protein
MYLKNENGVPVDMYQYLPVMFNISSRIIFYPKHFPISTVDQ